MRQTRLTHGTRHPTDEHDWAPLEALLGSDELCGHFMWMGDYQLDGGPILHAYKHRWTRSYIHLTADQRTFMYAGDQLYAEIEPADAVEAAFDGWERLEPTETEQVALEAALVRLWPNC